MPLRSAVLPHAAAIAGAVILGVAVIEMRDDPARPRQPRMLRPIADDTPRPSGRRHVNDCPMRYGIGADVETAWLHRQ